MSNHLKTELQQMRNSFEAEQQKRTDIVKAELRKMIRAPAASQQIGQFEAQQVLVANPEDILQHRAEAGLEQHLDESGGGTSVQFPERPPITKQYKRRNK